MKLLVEIVTPAGLIRKKCKIEENKVIIEKASKGRGKVGWQPSFDKNCLVPYFVGLWPFKRMKFKLVVKEGMGRCIDFFSVKKSVEVPSLTRKEVEKLGQARILKTAGATTQKVNVPLALYVLVLISCLISAGTLFYIFERFR